MTKDKLEIVYYVTQIICAFTVMSGGVIGVRQYVLSKRAEMNHFKNSRIQKAIELSEYYKDNILRYISFIYQVYKESGILDVFNNVRTGDINEFDEKELKKILTNDQRSQIERITHSDKFINAIVKYADIFLRKDIVEDAFFLDNDGKLVEAKKISSAKVLYFFENEIICGTLNNLEYFSMYFNYEIADKKTVYQSLHKTYMDMVELLYYDISMNNKIGGDRLFTNVIELYKTWKEIAEKQSRSEDNFSRNNIMKGDRAKTVA